MLKTQSVSLCTILAGAVLFALSACHASSQNPLPGAGTSQTANTTALSRDRGPIIARSVFSNRSLIELSAPLAPFLSAQAASGKDLIYASNFTVGNGEVLIFSAKDRSHAPIGAIASGIDEPEQITVDRIGNLYVANSGNNTVTVYPPGKLTPSAVYSIGVSQPFGVAVGKDGTVYIANETGSSQGTGSITVYPDGSKKPSKTLTLAGQYAFAVGLDAQNNLYASWWDPNTLKIQIVKYAPTTTSATGQNLDLDLPPGSFPAFDLKFDNAGNLVIAYNNWYFKTPNYIAIFPPGSSEPSKKAFMGGLLSVVEGIAFPRDSGQFLVANTSNGNWMQITYPGLIPQNVQVNFGVSGLALSPGT